MYKLIKYFVFCFFIMGIFTLNSQELGKKVFDKFCYCIDNSFNNSKELNKTDFMSCFKTIYQEEVSKQDLWNELANDIDTTSIDINTYNLGYDLAVNYMNDYMNKNYADFVWKCDSYYNLFQNSRLRELEEYVNDANSEKMKNLTYKVENFQIKNQFLLKRGIYYLALKKYSKAKDDLDRLIKLDSSNYEARLYIGIAYEELKEFDKAAAIYKKLYDQTDEINFMIFHEIAKRRKAELKD